MAGEQTPHAEYTQRRRLREASRDELSAREDRLATFRIGVFVAAVAVFFLLPRPFLIAPAVAFLVLVVWHGRTRKALADAHSRVSFYDRLLLRVTGEWSGQGPDGNRFQDPGHMYASDVDLFGRGSLFQRLTLCSTSGGEARLARWLKETPDSVEMVRRRQVRIESVRDELDFRENLQAALKDRSEAIDIENWLQWARRSGVLRPGYRWALFGCNLLVAVGVVLWARGQTSAVLTSALVIQSLFAYALRRSFSSALEGIEGRSAEVDRLAPVFATLETSAAIVERALGAQQAEVQTSPISPAVRSLVRLVELFDSRRNPFFAPFALAMMWNSHLAFLLERWRMRHGEALLKWFDILCEVEAVNSFAGYSYENPGDTLATLNEGEPYLGAQGLAHPLLPADRSVRNDVEIGGTFKVVLLSGSNMSGKSTFLRTIGINTVLAYSGARVRAHRFEIALMHLGCTLRIEDSLQEGKSRFYAELLRLKAIVDLAKQHRVLALIDEVLSGTNSKDRVIGAKSVIRSLLKHHAIGIVTTHDLALTELGEREAPIANFHFEDQCEGDRLAFDYLLRTGVLMRSSARSLMLALGFEVEAEAQDTATDI